MLAGIDEAGRGPVVGPLVVGLVAAESEEALRALGVRDSKLLSASRREALVSEIATVADGVEVVQASAADIDARRRRQSLNQIEVELFADLGRRIEAHTYYLDACDVDAARFGREFAARLERSPPPAIVSEHHADATYPLVSAASIVAKVRRDAELRKIAARLEPKVGLPLGSGYSHDEVTRRFLDKHLELFGRFPVEARQSWDTARQLTAAREQRRLDGFGRGSDRGV